MKRNITCFLPPSLLWTDSKNFESHLSVVTGVMSSRHSPAKTQRSGALTPGDETQQACEAWQVGWVEATTLTLSTVSNCLDQASASLFLDQPLGICTSSKTPAPLATAPATTRSTARVIAKTKIHVTRITWLLCVERLSCSPASPVTGQPRLWWRQHHSFFLKLRFNGVTPMPRFRFLSSFWNTFALGRFEVQQLPYLTLK